MSWLSEHSSALAGLGGVATIVAAIVAVFTLMRAGLDSASRSRPYVVVEFDVPEHGYKRIDLVVRNSGPTAARDLSVTFDPQFEDIEDNLRLGVFVARRFRNRVPVLGPGQALRSILMVDTEDESKSDVPESLTATVSYGSPWWRRRYRDTFVLTRVIYTSQVFSESSGSERSSLQKIATAAGKWESGNTELLRQLRLLQESVVAGLATEKPEPGTVKWRLRERTRDLLLLQNVGGATAFEVSVEGSADIRRLMVFDGDAQTVRGGSFLKLHVVGHGHGPELTVTWTDQPGVQAPRHTWTGRVPA